MRAATRALSLLLLALALGGCRYYDWPVQTNQHDPRALYSNLGEKRSATGDGPAWLNHGGTDFVAPRNTAVYSPDTGRVEFYDDRHASSATNAGLPPVKIGRFAMLHFNNAGRLEVNPAVLGDPTVWTWVVNPGDPIWIVKNNKPQQAQMPSKRKFVEGVRPLGNGNYEKVFWFNRRYPIGQTTGPDLHVIYYTDDDARYNDVGKIGNMLSAIEYQNRAKPECVRLRLFAAAPIGGGNKDFIADDRVRPSGLMQVAQHGGVDIVATCSSFKRSNTNRSGIYKIAYSIHRIILEEGMGEGELVPGPGGKQMVLVDPETVMWEYSRMPNRTEDSNLVASPPRYVAPGGDVSLFYNVTTDKHTAYVVTNTGGDDKGKWALDDLNRYPDGAYVVTVRAWNIAKSNGEGTAPDLSDTTYQRVVLVKTDPTSQTRELEIRKP